MNEEQQKIVTEEFESYNRMSFHDWLSECTGLAMYALKTAGQDDGYEDKDADDVTMIKLRLETEQVFCEVMLRRLQQHLQEMPKDFPELFQTKRAFVEIEYEIEGEDDEDYELLTVHKVTRDGEKVEMHPTMSDFGGPYWLLLEAYEDNLALVQETR